MISGNRTYKLSYPDIHLCVLHNVNVADQQGLALSNALPWYSFALTSSEGEIKKS